MAKILTGVSSPYRFNTPRGSTFDDIDRVPFETGENIWAPLRAVAWPMVRPGGGHRLVHTFNTVPLSRKPFVVGYEGELPRADEGWGKGTVGRLTHAMLMSPQCRGIFPVSRFSKRLAFWFATRNGYSRLAEKNGEVVYPSVDPGATAARALDPDDIVLTFVGRQWARQGGAAVARAARIFRASGRRVTIHVVSQMVYGETVHTDTLRDFYRDYLEDLAGDNVRHYSWLPPDDLQALLAASTFSLLPMLDGSFAYGALESMALGVPVIASDICAMPEIIVHQKNGLLLDLPVDAIGRWRHLPSGREHRLSGAYQARLAATFDSLAQQIVAAVAEMSDTPDRYATMSAECLATVRDKFGSSKIAQQWHGIYQQALHPSKTT